MEDIYNFLKLSDSIATGGQPTKEQFSAISESGYQVVVNLALPESLNALPDEKEVVETQGMEYVHIPVVWENPTLDDVRRFFSVMEANADKNIFVHCAANMRVSAFMYLYRLIHEGMSDEDAKRDLHQIWIPNDNWQKFIEQVIQYQ
ncbi:MAG: protein tyrosine phosphatase family protein [Cyanobacteriota bacterium]